jgi:hypothetical protein
MLTEIQFSGIMDKPFKSGWAITGRNLNANHKNRKSFEEFRELVSDLNMEYSRRKFTFVSLE